MNAKFVGGVVGFLAWLSTVIMFFLQITGDGPGWLIVFLPIIIVVVLGRTLIVLGDILENYGK